MTVVLPLSLTAHWARAPLYCYLFLKNILWDQNSDPEKWNGPGSYKEGATEKPSGKPQDKTAYGTLLVFSSHCSTLGLNPQPVFSKGNALLPAPASGSLSSLIPPSFSVDGAWHSLPCPASSLYTLHFVTPCQSEMLKVTWSYSVYSRD